MLSFADARKLARLRPSERVGFEAAGYASASSYLSARERELGPGDVLVYGEGYVFVAIFWNERFSNRVVFVSQERGPAAFLAGAERAGAKWVVVNDGSAEQRELLARKDQWQEVGAASMVPRSIAFRRLGR
jgi:hypothetical protein